MDGALDQGFDPGSGASSTVQAVALQPDGKVLLGGDFSRVDGVTVNRVARLEGGDSGPIAPSISVHPDGKTAQEGEQVIFEVVANGYPLNYQWKLNGDDIPGENRRILVIESVIAADAGEYTIRVDNVAGSVLSAVIDNNLNSILGETEVGSAGAQPTEG